MKDKIIGFFNRNKKIIITYLIIVAVAWVLGQMAVPALMKAIFVGGQI